MTEVTMGEILERMEGGESTAADAAALREFLAMQSMQQAVAASPAAQAQIAVGSWLQDRGMRDGWNDGEFAARMAVWAQVELADLLQLFRLPHALATGIFGPSVYSVMGSIEMAAALSTNLLARFEQWDGCSPDLDRDPALFEQRLVELMLPIMALADVMQIDLIGAVRQRLAEVGAGVGGVQ